MFLIRHGASYKVLTGLPVLEEAIVLQRHRYLSRDVRKPTFWFPTWPDTNQTVQLHKMAIGLKFRI